MKKFSDFADNLALDGDKIRIEDVLNKEIIVVGEKITTSRYEKNKSGKYLTLQFKMDGELKILFTGSDVLISQVEEYKEHMPFETVIKKINKYYSFT